MNRNSESVGTVHGATVTARRPDGNSAGHAATVEFAGLTVRFGSAQADDEVTALEDLDFHMKSGEFVALVGPSGCGKSTTLRCLAGLESPTEGRVLLDGTSVSSVPPSIGIMFQRSALLEWLSVRDNVGLALEVDGLRRGEARQRAGDLLRLAGLGDFLHHYPYQLSGGMQQRVAMCRALISDPTLLLMDEPFGALDALTRDAMGQHLQKICSERDITALLITHSVAEAVLLADRVLVMTPRPGRIAADVTIPLERPRQLSVRSDPRFAQLEGEILGILSDVGAIGGSEA